MSSRGILPLGQRTLSSHGFSGSKVNLTEYREPSLLKVKTALPPGYHVPRPRGHSSYGFLGVFGVQVSLGEGAYEMHGFY